MAKTVIGLDIGSWSIKAAVLESTLRGFALVDAVEHHIPRDPAGDPVEADISTQLRATLRDLREWDVLVTSAPGKRVLVRELELPFSDDKRIKSVLGFQLEDLLPFSLDELVYDYTTIQKDDEGSKLLCAAVEKRWLAQYLADMAGAEADPKLVTLDTLAFPSLLNQMVAPPVSDTVAMIDLGHSVTSVAIVSGGQTRAVRTIARGGHHVTRAIMKALNLDYGQAEQLKHGCVRFDGMTSPGVDPAVQAQVTDIARKALAPIIRDIRLTLHAYTTQWSQGIGEVLLFGGSARIPNIDGAMAEALGLGVRRTNVLGEPWSQVDGSPSTEASMPTATSLALCFLDEGTVDVVDFRQGEFAHESDYKALRDRAGWLLLMAAVLVMAFFGRQYVVYKGLERNHDALVAQLADYSGSVLGEESEDFEGVLAKVKRPPEGEDETFFPEMSAFKAFFDVTSAQDTVNAMDPNGAKAGRAPGPLEATPPGAGGGDDEDGSGTEGIELPDKEESGYKVELKQVQIDIKNAFIKGEANNIESVEALTAELKKNRCFAQVETSETTRISFGDRQDWLRFQLKIDISCKQKAEEKKAKDAKPTPPAKADGKDD